MWERLTFNFLKKYIPKVPAAQATPQHKHKLQSMIGEEVSQFLEASAPLTDKSLRQLELRLEKILSQEFAINANEPESKEMEEYERMLKRSGSKKQGELLPDMIQTSPP